jgi:hypothetical protein
MATSIKYLRGAGGIGLGTTIKFRAQYFRVDHKLPPCVHKQNPHQHSSPFVSAAHNNFPM